MMNTKKLVLLSIFVAQALVLYLIESYIPVPYGIPGIKLGLANIINLIVLILYGWKETVLVVIIRTFLASMLGGMPFAFFYSAAGGLMSVLIMTVMYKIYGKNFSLVVISVTGAVFHNVGQLIVAALVVESIAVFSYLPVLLLSGSITGFFIGLVVNYLFPFINKISG